MPQDPLKIPDWPRWYCARILDHWGYLREVRKVDGNQSEYICRACGWTGIRTRPLNKTRWYWF